MSQYFPYVSETEKTTGYENDLQLNNGSTVHISSYFNGYAGISGIEYWRGITRKGRDGTLNNPSEIINLYPFINQSGALSISDVTYVFNDIFYNSQDEEYYVTETYITKRENVYSKIKWVWGSVEKGGMFCFKDLNNNNIPTFYMLNGFYKKSEEIQGFIIESYGYNLSFAGSYSANTYNLSKVMFMYDADEMADGDPSKQFYAKMIVDNLTPNVTIDELQWVEEQGVVIGYTYEPYASGESIDIISLLPTAWWDRNDQSFTENDLGDPEFVFNLGNASIRDLYGNKDFTGLTHLSGNPWGDAEIDDESNPYSDAGFNEQGGGGASLDNDVDTSDPEDADVDNNPVDVCSSKLVLMYNPTAQEITSFNDFLYSGITDSMINTLKKLTTDPLQYIVSLGLVHFDPPTTVSQNISFGGIDTGVSALRISKQMKSFDCGYIDVKNEFKSFIDYNSRVSIFLPYIGYRELDINEIRGSRIRLKYNIDMLTGSCVAYLHINRGSRGNGDCKLYNNMYFFEGNCLLQIPMFATDNRGAIQSLMSLAGAGLSLATGNVASAMSGIVQSATQQKVAVGRAGNMGSNYGYISGQEPFLVIERPIISTPVNFGAFEGWTANIRRTLSQLHGYTEIDAGTLWVDGFDGITNDEMDMLKQITSSGFYL